MSQARGAHEYVSPVFPALFWLPARWTTRWSCSLRVVATCHRRRSTRGSAFPGPVWASRPVPHPARGPSENAADPGAARARISATSVRGFGGCWPQGNPAAFRAGSRRTAPADTHGRRNQVVGSPPRVSPVVVSARPTSADGWAGLQPSALATFGAHQQLPGSAAAGYTGFRGDLSSGIRFSAPGYFPVSGFPRLVRFSEIQLPAIPGSWSRPLTLSLA